MVRAGFSRPFEAVARGLSRLAGAPDGREAIVRLDKTVAGEEDEKALEKTFERRLT